MTWWDDLVAEWWPKDQGISPSDEVRRWLEAKYEVTKSVAPESIGELGVRAGYSAFAMLSAAPSASYLGIDVGWPSRYLLDLGALGREQGALDHARLILSRFARVSILEADSHHIGRLPPFDLLHIDGDHSFGGLASDLELAWRSGVRWVLVDDYMSGNIVGPTTHAWASLKGIEIEVIADGFCGAALLDLDAASDEHAHEDGTRLVRLT